MEDRKKQLELKKQKLAELKEQKKRREEEKRTKLLEHMQARGIDPATVPKSESATAEEIEKILLDAGVDSKPKLDPSAASGGRDASPAPSRNMFSSSRPTTLSVSEPFHVNIAPKEQVAYAKTTQTDSETEGVGGGLGGAPREFAGTSQDWWEDDDGAGLGGGGGVGADGVVPGMDGSPGADGMGMGILSEVLVNGQLPSPTTINQHHPALAALLPHHISLIKSAEGLQNGEDGKPGDAKKIPELSEEEKQQILSSAQFQEFFSRSSTVLERALTEKDEIFVDYSRGPDDQSEKIDTGAKLSFNRMFTDEKWTKARCVSSLDYSEQYPELIVAAYHDNPDIQSDPAGCVLVWNTKFKKDTPEYVFHCGSRVTAVQFAKFHPNLILGGTYSGQICLWDNRQNKKMPVQRSPLNTTAHTHPVYSMAVVGTQNAHNLVSISTDGRLCTWSLDMLSQPHEVLDLTAKNSRAGGLGSDTMTPKSNVSLVKTIISSPTTPTSTNASYRIHRTYGPPQPVLAQCLSFPLHDVNNFLIGSEDGGVYSGNRHGAKVGINDIYEGHHAPVTGLACHRAVGQVDFSQLFLTSSFDWSVKLWSTKENRAVHSFDNHSDYVMDVGWSPVHPALFAACDATGLLELWNLNADTELPATTILHQERAALSKLLWTQNGQQILVGDNQGGLSLYDVNEHLASPRNDEWSRLNRTLLDLKQAQIEAEELSQAMALSSSSAGVAPSR